MEHIPRVSVFLLLTTPSLKAGGQTAYRFNMSTKSSPVADGCARVDEGTVYIHPPTEVLVTIDQIRLRKTEAFRPDLAINRHRNSAREVKQ